MKKTILAVVTLIGFANAQSQEKVSFQFSDPTDLHKTKYKHCTNYRIEIQNINRFLYTVTAEKTERNFHTETPEILKGIKLPGFLTISTPPELANAPLKDNNAIELTALDSVIQKLYNSIKGKSEQLNNAAYLSREVNIATSNCKDNFTAIEKRLLDSINNFTGKVDRDISTATDRVARLIITNRETAVQELAYLTKITGELIKYTEGKIVNKKEEIRNAEYNIQNEKANSRPPGSVSIDLKKLFEAQYKATESLNDLIKSKDGLAANLKEAEEAVEAMKKFEKEGELEKLIDGMLAVNIRNFTYETELFTAKKDEIIYKITTAAEKPLPCNLPQTRTITVKGRTYNGWRFDFSTGVFLNTGNADFQGAGFSYKKINDDSSTIRRTDAGKSILLSVGGLLHLYYLQDGFIKPGISIGVSSSSGFDILNLHGGLSIILGDKQRFIISAGLTLRESKVLDREYQLNQPYKTALLPDTPPVTTIFPKAGGFFSLTYNITKGE